LIIQQAASAGPLARRNSINRVIGKSGLRRPAPELAQQGRQFSLRLSGWFQEKKMTMITEEQFAAAYADATDSTRDLVRWMRDNARREQRVKPDPETNPLAELDYEQEPTRGRTVGAGY
jgi:hypothetical protein